MSGPQWLDIARKYIGEREIKGSKHNPLIVKWFADIGAPWFKDDETPWCGAFVGGVLVEAGFKPPAKGAGARALAWLDYGVKLDRPAVGAIVAFVRDGGGHVGFVVGRDQFGNLMVLGGNQRDCVRIDPFAQSRARGFRWPSIWPKEERFKLPVVTSDGKLSTNEA